jgi:hypothetical protein
MMQRTKQLLIALATTVALWMATQAHATEDGCAVVLRTPDGFLNVREKPNARSRILKRLKPGEIILTDNARREESAPYRWDHVYVSQIAPGRPLWGWVRNKFIADVGSNDFCGTNWDWQRENAK